MSKQELYRDYVLAMCLYYGYKDSSNYKQDISYTVYTEIVFTDDVDLQIVKSKLDSLARNKIDSIKPYQIIDYNNEKPILINSVDYYNSERLRKEIKQIIKDLPDTAKRRRDY